MSTQDALNNSSFVIPAEAGIQSFQEPGHLPAKAGITTVRRTNQSFPQLIAVEAEALKLSPEDRVVLADHVLASVQARNEVEQAWGAEIDRRLAEVEARAVNLIPVEQAVARARQALL